MGAGGVDIEHYENFIDGRFVAASSPERILVRNPANGEAICTVPDSGPADVEAAVARECTGRLAEAMRQTRFGDPLADPTVDYGPLINEAGFRKVDRLVRGALEAGAELVTGGKRGPDERGYYYEPTVLAGCRQQMEIIRRETFGCVIPIVTFEDLDEAIAYANDSDYGLTSSIYTRDLNVALRACREIRFGETYINRENFEAMQGFHAGWRKSGIGGADGKHGLYEYLQTHVVYLQRD